MNISGESKTKHRNSHEMRFMEQNEVTYDFAYFLKYTKRIRFSLISDYLSLCHKNSIRLINSKQGSY